MGKPAFPTVDFPRNQASVSECIDLNPPSGGIPARAQDVLLSLLMLLLVGRPNMKQVVVVHNQDVSWHRTYAGECSQDPVVRTELLNWGLHGTPELHATIEIGLLDETLTAVLIAQCQFSSQSIYKLNQNIF